MLANLKVLALVLTGRLTYCRLALVGSRGLTISIEFTRRPTSLRCSPACRWWSGSTVAPSPASSQAAPLRGTVRPALSRPDGWHSSPPDGLRLQCRLREHAQRRDIRPLSGVIRRFAFAPDRLTLTLIGQISDSAWRAAIRAELSQQLVDNTLGHVEAVLRRSLFIHSLHQTHRTPRHSASPGPACSWIAPRSFPLLPHI